MGKIFSEAFTCLVTFCATSKPTIIIQINKNENINKICHFPRISFMFMVMHLHFNILVNFHCIFL